MLAVSICLCCFFGNNSVHAQEASWKDKIFTGGHLGLNFGTTTYIDISPLAGYKLNKYASVGAGITYVYYSVNNSQYKYSTNIYGGSVFFEYSITDNLLAHAEYELVNLDVYNFHYQKTERKNVGSMLVGGGYKQPIGGNSFLSMLVLWNLMETKYSPYSNPIIRMGFNIGL